jgi:hypothetical protein
VNVGDPAALWKFVAADGGSLAECHTVRWNVLRWLARWVRCERRLRASSLRLQAGSFNGDELLPGDLRKANR